MGKLISGIAVVILLLMLFGCGATNLNTAINPAQRFSITSGNWNFRATTLGAVRLRKYEPPTAS